MADYDFHTISPIDFEELTRDLLQARDGIILQSFKTGRDGGVDLRFASDGENRIVQCKHFRKSGYKTLLREVRKEVDKLKRIRPKPTRYVLSTSVELSNANKCELADVLGVSDTADILGSNDFNNLLGLYPRIERAHYKLWLSSTTVLQRVLHNAEIMQSDFEFKRIRRRLPRFVQSHAYNLAAKQFERDRILILSGSPGVGKTTIAEFLLYEKFADGFEPVIARNGLQEALALHKEGARQIFYYDDFLGATFLGEGGSAFVRNEDRTISDFISMVADDEDKFLILTTREHILVEALVESERLKQSMMTSYRFVVEIGTYTEIERARILYNNAYFNRLPRDYMAQLLIGEFYLDIISHPKFSPRLIDWMTSPRRIRTCAPRNYQRFAQSLLDDPSEIWQFAYDRQISQAARSLLLALHSLEGRASHRSLSESFTLLNAVRSRRYRFNTGPDDFLVALRILAGSFVTIYHNTVHFIDPSVRDLMNSVLLNAPDNCIDILQGTRSITQIQTILNLAETRDGEHILTLLQIREGEWVSGVIRALEASVGRDLGGNLHPRIEDRLVLLMDLAFQTNSAILMAEVAPTVERAIVAWENDAPDFRTTLYVLNELSRPPFCDGPVPESLRLQMRSALMAQMRYKLEPADVVQLLSLEPGKALDHMDIRALCVTVASWPSSMADRLRKCQSEGELQSLAEKLRSIEKALSVDLRGPIAAVETELRMYVEAIEPDDGDNRASERQWEQRVGYRSVSDIFDSLRHDED